MHASTAGQHTGDQQRHNQNGARSQGYRMSQAVDCAVLGVEIAHVRRRVDPGARHSLHQILRLELRTVAVDLLTQPAKQSGELTARSVGQVREISRRRSRAAPRQVPQRVGCEIAISPIDQWMSCSTPCASLAGVIPELLHARIPDFRQVFHRQAAFDQTNSISRRSMMCRL